MALMTSLVDVHVIEIPSDFALLVGFSMLLKRQSIVLRIQLLLLMDLILKVGAARKSAFTEHLDNPRVLEWKWKTFTAQKFRNKPLKPRKLMDIFHSIYIGVCTAGWGLVGVMVTQTKTSGKEPLDQCQL
ncbi:hypothetical protein CFP56_016866 [Quercus suber]|uniref:Uncharacterized protein n=1 Tax=Quercus suber TaxID=58331 RepID=A0AAW0KLC1_QUESU